MNQDPPRRRLSTDQKRALVIVSVVVVAIAAVAIAILQLGSIFGVPFWIAVIIIGIIVLAVILLGA